MKKLLSLTLILFIFVSAKATHNRSGEILYKRIAPFTTVVGSTTVQVYTYSITVIKYTSHGSTIADRCMDTVYFGDGQKGVAQRINGVSNPTCNCTSVPIPCGEIILNSPGYIVKKNVYSLTHTYAGPGSYILRSSDLNRNYGIRNIPNSGNVPFVLESLLIINAFTGMNSSPELTFAPIDQASLNVCFNHNPGAIDADGDSLSYEITPCNAPGYFFPEGSYSINSITGLLSWCTPQYLDEYNVAILIKEWRKNTSGVYQLIGQIMRDMQILVKYGVVGITENKNSNEGIIFPNPTSSQLKITFGERSISNFEFSIIDINSQLVLHQQNTEAIYEWNCDISKLSKGIYLIRMVIDGETQVKKILKE